MEIQVLFFPFKHHASIFKIIVYKTVINENIGVINKNS